jgi:hypothetical protein
MRRKKLVITLIVVSFILLVASVVYYLEMARQQKKLDPAELEIMTKDQIIQYIYTRQAQGAIPFYYFIPIFAFFGITVGALIYYIMSGDVEKKEEIIKYDTQVILKLLNPDERKVINKIVENGGKVQQMEITYTEGFTKVKAHRIIESLVMKGILHKEKMGKMRLIRMQKELYDLLKR